MNKSGVMESQELRVTEEQNSKSALAKESPVLKLFAEFYGIEKIPRYSELTKNCEIEDNNDTSFKMSSILNVFKTKGKFDQFRGYKEITGTINSKQFLYIPGYNQRNRLVFEILMAEANYRAKKAKKKAYIHVVGLGLGVWRIYKNQVELFTSEFLKSVIRMRPEHVSHVDFSWVINHGEQKIDVDGVILRDGDLIPETNIRMHISKRNPWDKLPPEHEDKLVVASWAWDGMSFVGNEYWAGSLMSSSDPAAACCTQIPELLNPFVNPVFCGKNAMVVTENGEMRSINDVL